jgi:hypothetical protein
MLRGGRFRTAATLATLAGALLALVLATSASAYIYVGNGPSIARANNDGTGLDPDFVAVDGFACGVAVTSTHIYWTDLNGVGRANLDGTGVQQNLPGIPTLTDVCGVAVDATHVYWADRSANSIGRADLDGGNPNLGFVGLASPPCGVAVDSQYVYWAGNAAGTPQRALLSAPVPGPLPNAVSPASCAVGVGPGSVYYANRQDPAPTAIHGVSTTGGGVFGDAATGVKSPCGIAIHGSTLYWTGDTVPPASAAGLVGAVPLDANNIPGTPNPNLVVGLRAGPCGIAVNDLPVSPPNTRITQAAINSHKGNAAFKFKAVGSATGFQCELERKHKEVRFKKCASPKRYKHLTAGKYKFEVRAVGHGGRDPSPAKKKFRIS